MNINHVISLAGSADLTGLEYSVVKLTSTGVALAASGDNVLGTLLRASPHQEDGVYLGKAVAVQLWNGGVHYAKLGADTSAVAIGDTLAVDGSNPGQLIKSASNVVAVSAQAFTAVQGAVVQVIFTPPGATGASGYSGFSGPSGYSGYSGKSGYSGFSGA